MTTVMITLIFALSVHSTAAVLTKGIATFLTVHNGYYTNAPQIEAAGGHDFVQATVIPVTVPAFPDTAFQYGEWACDDDLLMMNLFQVTEDKNGVIYLTVCSFTNISEHVPRTYNIDNLATLKAEDIQCNQDCKGAFQYEGNGSFLGTWPDCNDVLNGHHLTYSDELKCDYFTTVVPDTSKEESSLIPYTVTRKGKKYPVKDAPDDFVSPCN